MTDRAKELRKYIVMHELKEHINFAEWRDELYIDCVPVWALKEAYELLKEQELRELTKNEWEQWKNNPRRDPICMLWYKDTTPMWILTPVEVHEPAYLMGKVKLFNRKPTTEEIQGVKWDD